MISDAERRKATFHRELARFNAMLARLRPLFADSGFLALRLPEPRRGDAGTIVGFDGPEIHAYGEQQWVHLYAPSRTSSANTTAPSAAESSDASAPLRAIPPDDRSCA